MQIRVSQAHLPEITPIRILRWPIIAVFLASLFARPVFPLTETRAEPGAPSPTAASALPTIPKPDLTAAPARTVVRVVDGDTIVVDHDGQEETVRLLGIDTPETQDPRKQVEFFAREASDFLTNLLNVEQVYFVQEQPGAKDKYGLTLAHVYRAPDGLWVNLELVRQGYAQVYSPQAFRGRRTVPDVRAAGPRGGEGGCGARRARRMLRRRRRLLRWPRRAPPSSACKPRAPASPTSSTSPAP